MVIVRKSNRVLSIKQSTESGNQWRDNYCSLVGHYELLDQMLQCSGKEGRKGCGRNNNFGDSENRLRD